MNNPIEKLKKELKVPICISKNSNWKLENYISVIQENDAANIVRRVMVNKNSVFNFVEILKDQCSIYDTFCYSYLGRFLYLNIGSSIDLMQNVLKGFIGFDGCNSIILLLTNGTEYLLDVSKLSIIYSIKDKKFAIVKDNEEILYNSIEGFEMITSDHLTCYMTKEDIMRLYY